MICLLMDKHGKICDIGEEGELVVKTLDKKPPGLFGGYYKDKAKLTKYGTMDIIIQETQLGRMKMDIYGLLEEMMISLKVLVTV